MMGRLGKHVRDEQGLAYYVHTTLEAGLGAGPWAILAGVAPEHVEQAIAAVLEQVSRLREEPVNDEELADNKAYLIGSMPLGLEGNEGIAAQIAQMELYDLGLDYMQRLPGLIEAITVEDVQAAAQRYLRPHEYVLSIAGPEA
jgi:zinc protease